VTLALEDTQAVLEFLLSVWFLDKTSVPLNSPWPTPELPHLLPPRPSEPPP